MRVLLLEDDRRLCKRMAARMRRERWVVDEVSTLRGARQRPVEVEYDCLVLDRMLPDGDALDLVVEVKEWPDPPPVLLISGRSDGAERVLALQSGDDFLPKPVHMDEVVLRVDRLHQLREGRRPVPMRVGRVAIDRAHREVLVDGGPVHVSDLQYALLDYLVAHMHRVVEIEEILARCWDRNRDMVSNPLRIQICRLRQKFDGILRFDMVRGQGYIVRAATDPTEEPAEALDHAS